MPNLLEKVTALREIARDFARLYAINRWLWQKTDLSNKLKSTNDGVARDQKDLAIMEFDLAHLDPTHPNFTEDKANIEKEITNLKLTLALNEKNAALETLSLNNQITELDQKITDIQAGKINVTREHVDEQFDRLVSRMDSLD